MEKALDSALVWFRRDLRADDNAALFHALKAARQVRCAFVFDSEILDALPRATGVSSSSGKASRRSTPRCGARSQPRHAMACA